MKNIYKHCHFCNSPTTNSDPGGILVKIYPDRKHKGVLVPTYVHPSCVWAAKNEIDEMRDIKYVSIRSSKYSNLYHTRNSSNSCSNLGVKVPV